MKDIDSLTVEVSLEQLTSLKMEAKEAEKLRSDNESLKMLVHAMREALDVEHINICKDVEQYNRIYHGGSFSASSLSDCYEPRRDKLKIKLKNIDLEIIKMVK